MANPDTQPVADAAASPTIITVAGGAVPWTALGSLAATRTVVGDALTGAWSDLGTLGSTQTLTG